MNAREKRIRILDLQDQYCQRCEYKSKLLKHCTPHCEVGEELMKLGKELFVDSSIRRKYTEEHWECICQKAVILHEEGMGYTAIAKQLNCHPSGLHDQLKKRGLWCGESRKAIQENSREKWMSVCEQAVGLKEQGMSYSEMAKKLGVDVTKLRRKMKQIEFSRGMN
ncbi:zinc-finger domain-containing protein [Bacillus thuringiensis]|uniref:zinc-finger domain-containing protein n=1 Tax=Bacillus thuringiensis TaxID=1428 RepID=UPI000E48241D|nr:zinc-finger domain-containing protein [Bacillus thuringiensis]MDZ3952364.1 zinc-finger domain-containing protein [Bacillus thuringiensis]RGP45197.1 hypothetical protein BTW32_25810 [Bacillus thuringiensis]